MSDAITFLAITFGAGFVAILIFSRIIRWLLSSLFKGPTLSVVADVLTVGAGVIIFTLRRDVGQDVTWPILGYVVGGLVVLTLDLVLDPRRAKRDAS